MEKEDQIIELYESGKSTHEVSKETGVSQTQVRRILYKFSVPIREKGTPKIIEQKIVTRYSAGESSEKIAKDLSLNGTTICRVLKRNGVEIRQASESHKKYVINHDFFESIDSQEKAYILGFMYADGNVHSVQPSIKIELHEKDIDIIEKIQDCLFVGEKSKIGIDRDVYRFITVRSERIKEDLIKHGCMPNKTFKVKMPVLRDDLVSHFLRGLYDGDGCISTASGRVRVILTGLATFMNEVQSVIEKFTGIKAAVRMAKKKQYISDVSITNNYDSVRFLNWLYAGATIYLKRKYDSYQSVLDICKPAKNGSTNIVSYNGDKLTRAFVEALTAEERESVAKFLFDYFRQNGFPYNRFSDTELAIDFRQLEKLNVPIGSSEIRNIPDCGLKIFRHFCHHFYNVRGGKKPSMLDAFNDDELLLGVIRNRLGITYKEVFNITGNMIRQGIRNSRAGFAASLFKPALAKTIYDHYSPDGGVVLDISAGFGQRMLGAMASKKVSKYIGLDPWDKQISALTNIKEHFKFENVELHQIGSEHFCPIELAGKVDFCFSSPPFFDKEIYCDDENQAYANKTLQEFLDIWWVLTYKNVHSLLKNEALFVLNMNKGMAEKMIEMCKDHFKLVETRHIKYSRAHLSTGDGFDYFFCLQKLNP